MCFLLLWHTSEHLLLVILDEPTSGVDAYERQLLWKMASYFVNTTTIIASHSLEEGESVASRVFVMDEGKIIFMGTPSELRARYKCGYRLNFDG
ncbi:ATPase activity, coupled to transmembrane movement of substances [Trichomonas vaginalis G3]|uniref:ATPase activity, coupled to transmembrane movement of substances n=1 Tax=Trichomonas vaginalis (strain ATCC PRA-98 / G3) TaxID=412133 RepID=UPI0021E56E42|nr:ATPase activity, coupled to transmembrane movement of substances [Trichomonas vaginalis G3]KAI5509057.1 ATPase activity, coupled to transmembrane movement of substances [Trichomonas vaginalis G3]